MTSDDPDCLSVQGVTECWVEMHHSAQYDVLQQAGLGASHHPYVMRNNYWTSPATAAVRQFPYYSKYSLKYSIHIGLMHYT